MEKGYLLIVALFFLGSLFKHIFDAMRLSKYKLACQSQELLLENAMEGFVLHEIVLDEMEKPIDYRFLLANHAFEEMTGLKKEAVQGKCVLEIMPKTEPYWIELYGKVVLEQVKIHETHYSEEMDKYFEVSAYPLGELKFAVLFTDVTERIRKNFELNRALCRIEQTNELKSQFLHDINHRLRTPLNGMMGMLQLVDRNQMSADNSELFEAMALEMKHTRNIINQIAKYIDIQGMATHYSIESLDHLIIEGAKQVDENENAYKAIKTEWIIRNQSSSQSYIDRDIIQKVFKEIYLNAKKHTRKGKITVAVENEWHQEAGLYYTGITITDYGEGIERDKLRLIFNEFYHHDFVNIYKDDERYSIPMCKQMMLKCGGDLIIDSQVDVGTAFTMIIPAYKDETKLS